MNIAVADTLEPEPIAIDPRPCGLCGLAIDRHEMVDDGEGPEHYCPEPDDLTLDEMERRAELVREIEVAASVRGMELNDHRDAWRHTGEAPPPASVRNSDIAAKPASAPRYSTPKSTIDAFRYLIKAGDVERIKGWLTDRPADAPYLLSLLED
jgi:hypothetical protein